MHVANYKDALENVQRRATKQINGMLCSIQTDQKSLSCQLLIGYRRIRGDMIEIVAFITMKLCMDNNSGD